MMSNVINPENEVVALVKTFSGFNSLEDLKNHNACFSGYRDLGKNKECFAKEFIPNRNLCPNQCESFQINLEKFFNLV